MRALVVLLILLSLSINVFAQNDIADTAQNSTSNETANQPQEPPVVVPIMVPPPADDSPVPGTVLDARKFALSQAAAQQVVRMDAAIAIATEKSLDDSSLKSIRDAFDKERQNILAATSTGQLSATEDLLQDLAKNFLTASKEIGLRAYVDLVKGRMKKYEEERGNESEYYGEQAVESRKIAMLRFFDQHVELVSDAINKSVARNVSMVTVQAKLDEFIAIKPALVSAINSRDKKQIQEVDKRIKDDWKAIRDALTQAHLSDRIRRSIDAGDDIGSRVETNMRKLRTAGIATGALEKRLGDFRKYLAQASTAADAGDYSGAQEELRQAKTELIQLRTTYDQVRTGTLKQAAGGPK